MSALGQGKRLLEEVETETLAALLTSLQTSHQQTFNTFLDKSGIPDLDKLWKCYSSGQLQLCGRYRTLLYHIVSHVVSEAQDGAVLVVDTDGKFDITQLTCSRDELKHVYIVRTNGMERVQQALRDSINWLTYHQHASRGRELKLKILSGGPGPMGGLDGFDIIGGWRGWLRVESGASEVMKFGPSMSVEEALEEAKERWEAVEASGWFASCDQGEYSWGVKQLGGAA